MYPDWTDFYFEESETNWDEYYEKIDREQDERWEDNCNE